MRDRQPCISGTATSFYIQGSMATVDCTEPAYLLPEQGI